MIQCNESWWLYSVEFAQTQLSFLPEYVAMATRGPYALFGGLALTIRQSCSESECGEKVFFLPALSSPSFSTSSSTRSHWLDLFWVKTAAHCVTLLIPCTLLCSSSLKHCLCPLINKTRFSFYFFDPCLPAEQKFPSITASAWDPSPFYF